MIQDDGKRRACPTEHALETTPSGRDAVLRHPLAARRGYINTDQA